MEGRSELERTRIEYERLESEHPLRLIKQRIKAAIKRREDARNNSWGPKGRNKK